MAAILVDEVSVRTVADPADIRSRVGQGAFFWLDLVGIDPSAYTAWLSELGLDVADIAWAMRFGQTGRMLIGRQRLRVATWIADSEGALIELHLVGCAKGLATVWDGDPAILERIRRQFAERAASSENNFYLAAGILLQLLLAMLDHILQRLDRRIDELRFSLDKESSSADFASITRRLQGLQTFAASFSRYSSAVRSATVGVENVPGVGDRGAEELNDYVEQVEDFEEQLYERRRWMSDITHDFATAIAQRQSEQISRLTLVSMIFLPVTALTGFFGMNFEWLNRAIASRGAFFLLGVLIPALSVILTVAWLWRKGLVRLGFRR
jgi:Mg2+ and Co2+ transporter CorA